MTVFWIVVGLMIVAALLFLIPPLLQRQPGVSHVAQDDANLSIYRQKLAALELDHESGTLDDRQFAEDRDELLRRMLDDIPKQSHTLSMKPSRHGVVVAGVVATLLPVAAVAMYLLLGNPDAFGIQAQKAESHHTVSPEQIIAMVEGLAERMKQNPNDGPGWIMLARSYNVLERYSDAVHAYERATQLVPQDAQLFADYADTLAVVQGRKLEGRPLQLIETALNLDGNNLKALALAGTAAFERKDYASAIAYWQRIEQRLPAESEDARSIKASIAEARAASTEKPAASLAVSNDAQGASQRVTVSGVVELASELKGKVVAGDTLFIFARARNGPKMPLAIVRAQAGDLPKTFTLDDTMAMAPAMKLSKFPEVVIGARVSKSGSAMPQSGDLQGLSAPTKPGSAQIKVIINEVVP